MEVDMADYTNDAPLRELTVPARNNYFYGKMLDVMHFQMEQAYFNRKRWLLNRLGLGAGVLCGLEVVVADDGQCIWLRPGVAIDPLGREIIVPAPYCLENPRQPTDDCGRPLGDPIEGAGAVTLCLAYHECATEPVPVLVGDCEKRGDCAPSTVRERYRLLVRAGLPDNEPGQLSAAQCRAIFPTMEMDDDFSHSLAACETLSDDCPELEGGCVVVATLTLPEVADEPLEADACTYRTSVYSNSLLWELMTCLAARVDACCRVRVLRYVSGDAQQATPGESLAEPLVVRVVNGDDQAVAGEVVTFAVRAGGGRVRPRRMETDVHGRAATNWRLGSAAGLQTVEASIASGAHVLFMALAVAGDEERPSLQCVAFEETPVNTRFAVGDSFVEAGVTIEVRTFFLANGDPIEDGFALIEGDGQAGGSRQDVQVNNVNLAFAFGVRLAGLSLQFGEFGGSLNLDVNGDLRNFNNFTDIDGDTIGGADVDVNFDPDNQHGVLTLRGVIETFAVGGQELWLDDVCPLEN
jgi:hypothetical protein